MSTFDGVIAEIPGVIVDFFESNEGKCYFLSHCHTDHMVGLGLLSTSAPIYTTSISGLIISRNYPSLQGNIRILEVGIATVIKIAGHDQDVVVTALSAGHCVGACMLLFQTDNRDILYTGDFRISLENLKKFPLLQEVRNNEQCTVYLDSTFLKKTFSRFPKQTESVQTIVSMVESFFSKSNNSKGELVLQFNKLFLLKFFLVFLEVPARYGYEYLLMELSAKLKEKIFICEPEVFNQYLMIPQLQPCVTTDLQSSRIILKPKFVSDDKLQCTPSDDSLRVQLSAMFWVNWDGGPLVRKTARRSYRVCYATHCSFNEIRDFLTFLKPKSVHLNVLPANHQEKQEMLQELQVIQKSFMPTEENLVSNDIKKFTFKRLFSQMSREVEQ